MAFIFNNQRVVSVVLLGFVRLRSAYSGVVGRHQVVNQATNKCLDYGAINIVAVECDANNPKQFFEPWQEGRAGYLFGDRSAEHSTLDAGGQFHVWEQASAGAVVDNQRFIVNWDIGTIRHVPSKSDCFTATCLEEVEGVIGFQACDRSSLFQRWSPRQANDEPVAGRRVMELGSRRRYAAQQSPNALYSLRATERAAAAAPFINEAEVSDSRWLGTEVTRSYSYAGDYNTIIGAQRKSFLEECTFLAASCGASCSNVQPGSIMVDYTGSVEAVADVVTASEVAGRLPLRSFDVGASVGEVGPGSFGEVAANKPQQSIFVAAEPVPEVVIPTQPSIPQQPTSPPVLAANEFGEVAASTPQQTILATAAPVPEVVIPTQPSIPQQPTSPPVPAANEAIQVVSQNPAASPNPAPSPYPASSPIPSSKPHPMIVSNPAAWRVVPVASEDTPFGYNPFQKKESWRVWAERVTGMVTGGACLGLVCVAVGSCVLSAFPKSKAPTPVPVVTDDEKSDGEDSARQPMLPAQLIAARKAEHSAAAEHIAAAQAARKKA